MITDNCPVGLRKFRARVRANFMALAIWVFGIAFVSWLAVQLHPSRYTIISGGMGQSFSPVPVKTGFWVVASSFAATQTALAIVGMQMQWRRQWFWVTVITFLSGLAFGGLSALGIISDPIYFVVFMLPYGILFASGSLLTTLLVLNRSHFGQLTKYFEFKPQAAAVVCQPEN